MSNYATKTDSKNVTHVDTSCFAIKTNLANLKTEVDKLDIEKLAPVPVDLSKLSDVVKNDVVKKTVYDKLVAKVNNIDTSDFVLKTQYNTDKTEVEIKIGHVSNLVKKTKLRFRKQSSWAALTTVENKMSSFSNLVKKNKKKQTIKLKLQNLKIDLIIIIMTNILMLQSFIN